MKSLSIETTGRFLSLALHEWASPEKVQRVDAFFQETPSMQAELLIPSIARMLEKNKMKLEDLSLLACDVGPGSFTGVRVGLSTARAMAQGLSLPLVGVNSLEAMAWPLRNKQDGAILMPRLPAVPGEVYFAAYKTPFRELQKPVWKEDAVFEKAVKKFSDALLVETPPRAEAIGEIGVRRYLKSPRSKAFHYERVVPLYLLPSWAERKKPRAR